LNSKRFQGSFLILILTQPILRRAVKQKSKTTFGVLGYVNFAPLASSRQIPANVVTVLKRRDAEFLARDFSGKHVEASAIFSLRSESQMANLK
jgi:hypothetical protein